MLSEMIDEWEKELRQDGWEKGRQEGRQQELRKLLTLFLEKRFGALPARLCTRLHDASLEELESWTEHLLDAKSLDDVAGCLEPTRVDS